MEYFMYVWFDICNFITRFITPPLLMILFVGPILIEAGIHILVVYKKGEELDDVKEWAYNKSKMFKLLSKARDFFRIIEY